MRIASLASTLIIAASLLACGGADRKPASTLDTAGTTTPGATIDTVAHRTIAAADTAGCGKGYAGTINNTIPIVMSLCTKGDELSGTYRYLRVGKDIEIQGHLGANGDVVLYEWGDGPKHQTGNFLGRFVSPTRIEGTWQSPKGDRSIPFILVLADSVGHGAGTDQSSFTGSWTIVAGGGASFDLDLVQQGSKLTGRHCAATENATRVDCWMNDGDPDTTITSVEGTVTDGVANVTFKSAYGETDKGEPVTGKAQITHEGAMIHWHMVGEPDGDEYLPVDATLKRATSRKK